MNSNLTVTFFSNFLIHHQTPFCEAMINRIGDGFRFVATEPTPKERLNMGYRDYTDTPYVVYSYKDENQYKEALRLGAESDVVIIGSAPDEFIKERLRQNKLTFRYCERFFKEGKWRIFDPRVFSGRFKNDFRYRNKNLYMLCASAYTAPDCRFILSYPNKTYKWGYFPEVDTDKNIDELISRKTPNSILWAGRQINWKHPEYAVYVAKRLKENNTPFTLNIIGDGDMHNTLKNMICENNLQNEVHLLDSMSPDKVREHMAKSEIFLFTSDKNEGWGAVLNEAMSAGCAVVASGEIGSVPYLIANGENGLVYDRKDKNALLASVKRLIDNPALRRKIQKNAYETIKDVWNAEVATDRLLHLIDCIKNGTETGYKSGPCSRD